MRQRAIVAVVGAGTIGLALVLMLRDLDLESIFLVGIIEEKLELGRTFGAKTIHAGRDQPAQVIAGETGGRRANCVFEAVGNAATVGMAYDLCDSGGTVVLIGNLAKEFTLPLPGVTSNETTIRGSYGLSRMSLTRRSTSPRRKRPSCVISSAVRARSRKHRMLWSAWPAENLKL